MLQQGAQQIRALLEKEGRLLREFRQHGRRIITGQIRAHAEFILFHFRERGCAREVDEVGADAGGLLGRDHAPVADDAILLVKDARLRGQRGMGERVDGHLDVHAIHGVRAKAQPGLPRLGAEDFRKAGAGPRAQHDFGARLGLILGHGGGGRREFIGDGLGCGLGVLGRRGFGFFGRGFGRLLGCGHREAR